MRNLTMGLVFVALFALLVIVEVVSPYQYDCRMIHHMVESGETVWDIADKYMAQQDKIRDIREMMWEIRRESGKDTYLVHRGEVLTIPLYKRK